MRIITVGRTRPAPSELAELAELAGGTPLIHRDPAGTDQWILESGGEWTQDPRPDADLLLSLAESTGGEVLLVGLDNPGCVAAAAVIRQRTDIVAVSSLATARRLLEHARSAAGPRLSPESAMRALGLFATAVSPPVRPRDSRPKHRVVSLVGNKVMGDSRVQKVAASLARLGYESILIGVHPEGDLGVGDSYLVDGATVLRAPVGTQFTDVLAPQPLAPGPDPLLHSPAARRFADEWDALVDSIGELGALVGGSRHVRPARLAHDDPAPLARAARNRWRLRRRLAKPSDAGHPAPPAHSPGPGGALNLALVPRVLDYERAVGPLLDELEPDVIHAHDADTIATATAAAARLRSRGLPVRLVLDVHEHTVETIRANPLEGPTLAGVEKRAAPLADAVITVSDWLADHCRTAWELAERPTVVQNTALDDPSEPRGPDIRGLLGLAPGIPLAVYVGGLQERRGVHHMIAALPLLAGVHFVMVAPPGSRATQLEDLAAGLGVADRVHRVDYVPYDKVVDLLRTADVGIIPFEQTASHVGVPTKYFEFTAAGLPIVASGIPLVEELLRAQGNGLSCRDKDPEELARAVAAVLADLSGFRSAITPEIRARAQWSASQETLADLYRRLTDHPPRTRWTFAPTSPRTAPDTAAVIASRGDVAAKPRPHVTRPHVIVGPRNTAGQAQQWAGALRKAGIDSTAFQWIREDQRLVAATDVQIHTRDAAVGNRLGVLTDFMGSGRAILLESLYPMVGLPHSRGGFRQGLREAQRFVEAGCRVGIVLHGSDVRSPIRHRLRYPGSPFALPGNDALTARLLESSSTMKSLLNQWEGPLFYTTHDLREDVPEGVWLPQVVDIERFAPDGRDCGEDARPMVLHAPSHSGLKGSDIIDEICGRLTDEGVIRYRRVNGLPPELMPEAVSAADIIVDQVSMELVSVTALEAMASGRVVVASFGEEMARRYPEGVATAPADRSTLEAVLRRLAGDPGERRDRAAAGIEYTREWHDGRRSALVIAEGLGLS